MKIEKLTLSNFRNIKRSTFHPSPTLNFLIGQNGQGKTSFLEALSFLSSLRSFREAKAVHAIQWGEQKSEISCSLISHSTIVGDWKTECKIVFQSLDEERSKVSKAAFINEKAFRSSVHYLSERSKHSEMGFHAVVFNPSDHDLVRGDSLSRRNYLNRVIAAEDIEYLKILQKYQRVLDQRNALLKSMERPLQSLLQGFGESLTHLGALIAFKRLQWLEKLFIPLNQILQKIAPGELSLRLIYRSNWVPEIKNLSFNNNNLYSVHFTGQGGLGSLELLEQSFRAKLISLEAAELRAGHTLVGPHRDDWTFFLGEQILKGHGSQGEIRSALLALKLAELELFRSETGHRPVFLLDDFSSELDRNRRLFLLKFLTETDLQTFVTMTEEVSSLGKKYWISDGEIEEGKYDNRTKAIGME